MRTYLILGRLLSFCVFMLVGRSLSASPVDFNGDGLSDITLIAIRPDQSLRWKSILSPLQIPNVPAPTVIGDLGAAGDHIALGRWSALSAVQPAVISQDGGEIVWKSTGGQFSFGSDSDLLVAGGDFNGNGFADAAAISKRAGRLVWKIKYDPLAPNGSGSPGTAEIVFGTRNDQPFFVNPDGARDWLAIVRTPARGGAYIIMRDPASTTVRRVAIGSVDGTPLPVAENSSQDVLVAFIKRGAHSTTASFRSLSNGARRGGVRWKSQGDLIVGDYASDTGQELAIQTSDGFSLYNPFSKLRTAISTADGIAVDEVNLNSFGGSGNSGGGGSAPADLNGICSKVIPISSPYIYKTGTSDHIPDSRSGGGSFLVGSSGSRPSVDCVYVYDSKGAEIASYGFWPSPGSDWAARLYSRGLSCSDGKDPLAVAAQAIKHTGSPAGFFKVSSNTCIKVSDLRQCYGSSHC
ncbi:MAG: hypothetical protein K1X83_07565 [Oligoflexia bacterium]|nr:hypothetical protein [Oligoflexia bacterium]